ncbi:MAG: hypothetical protein HGB19_13145, partial [Chlorobiales bacterium]|nr:hypothetical protein [Chlorobiales bacterium]
ATARRPSALEPVDPLLPAPEPVHDPEGAAEQQVPEVDKELAKLAEKTEISAERVIREISEIAFQKLNKNELKKLSANKLKALEHLGKHFKLFTDVQEITGKDGGPQVIVTLPANGTEKAK